MNNQYILSLFLTLTGGIFTLDATLRFKSQSSEIHEVATPLFNPLITKDGDVLQTVPFTSGEIERGLDFLAAINEIVPILSSSNRDTLLATTINDNRETLGLSAEKLLACLNLSPLLQLNKEDITSLAQVFVTSFLYTNLSTHSKAHVVLLERLPQHIKDVIIEEYFLVRNALLPLYSIENLFKNLKQLSLSGLPWKKLHRNLLQTLPHLEVFSITDSKIEYIPKTFFAHLPALRKLILRNNNLQDLPESISTRERLEVLDISGNRLVILPKRLFYNLGNLEQLLMNNNSIIGPLGLDNLTSLEVFSAHHNNIEQLPAESFFKSRRTLQTVDVEHNRLSENARKMLQDALHNGHWPRTPRTPKAGMISLEKDEEREEDDHRPITIHIQNQKPVSPKELEAISKTLIVWQSQQLTSVIHKGNLEALQEYEADGLPLFVKNIFTDTGLHIAASLGELPVIKELLKHYHVAVKNRFGETVLHKATRAQKTVAVDFFAHTFPELIPIKNSSNQTALHIACYEGTVELAQTLINYGADINEQGAYKTTPLIEAIKGGNREIIKLLLSKMARTDLVTESGDTAAQAAFNKNYLDILKLIVKDNHETIEKKEKKEPRYCNKNDKIDGTRVKII